MIEISVNGRKLEIPAFVQPGAADKTITIELGYGRSNVGVVGTGVGFNARLLTSKIMVFLPGFITLMQRRSIRLISLLPARSTIRLM